MKNALSGLHRFLALGDATMSWKRHTGKGNRMDKKMRLNGRHLFLVFLALVLAAGCGSGPQAAPVGSVAGATITATPDPLYSIHCPRETKSAYLCYPGEKLIGDNALMEKAATDFCLVKIGRCSVFLWKDEASVGQTYPLTDAETKSLIATYLWDWVTYAGCFKAYQDGQVLSTSGTCGR
jgi:hypothetical protein